MSEMYTERLLDHVRHPRHKGLLVVAAKVLEPGTPGAAHHTVLRRVQGGRCDASGCAWGSRSAREGQEGESASPPGQILAAEEYNPLCGDRVTFQVRLVDGRLAEARFEGRGCALCLGAASILTEVVEGQTLDALQALDQDAFLSELQSEVRPARLRCALLPWVAFRRAAFGEET